MEIEEIYIAARDGDVRKLREILKYYYLGNKIQDNTPSPLLIAIKNGHLDCVKILIEKHEYQYINETGSIIFDNGIAVEGITPLGCAVEVGHMNIMIYLLENGGSIHCGYYSPIYAACKNGFYSILKYLVDEKFITIKDIEKDINSGTTCLMIACLNSNIKICKYLLEKCSTNYINRINHRYNNGILHYGAASGSLQIIELLIKCSKINVVNYSLINNKDLSPLLCASINCYTDIVEYLIKHVEKSNIECISKLDIINSLELLGAGIVDKENDIFRAIKYWEIAMNMRENNINNIENNKILITNLKPVYEYSIEFKTRQELYNCINLEEYDKIRIHALLIRERILGYKNPYTIYYIKCRGNFYLKQQFIDYKRCIKLWMYALDIQQKNLKPLSFKTYNTFVCFYRLFSLLFFPSAT